MCKHRARQIPNYPHIIVIVGLRCAIQRMCFDTFRGLGSWRFGWSHFLVNACLCLGSQQHSWHNELFLARSSWLTEAVKCSTDWFVGKWDFFTCLLKIYRKRLWFVILSISQTGFKSSLLVLGKTQTLLWKLEVWFAGLLLFFYFCIFS